MPKTIFVGDTTANDEKTKKILSKILDDKIEQFYVDRERHHAEHMWLQEMMKWSNEIKSSVLKSIVKAVVLGIVALIIAGFIVYKGS